tara:strand:- start:1228 stop:1410 length:183 start_codon:yes stop_codon:yes gene_type:complete
VEYFLIQLFCLAILIGAASYNAYKIGVRTGTSGTIDKLHELKIISYDNKGNIVPNPFFDA